MKKSSTIIIDTLDNQGETENENQVIEVTTESTDVATEMEDIVNTIKMAEIRSWTKSRFIITTRDFMDYPNNLLAYIYHTVIGILLVASIYASYHTLYRTYFDYCIEIILIIEIIVRLLIGIAKDKLQSRISYLFSVWMILDYYLIISMGVIFYLEKHGLIHTLAHHILLSTQTLKIFHVDRYVSFLKVFLLSVKKYSKQLISAYFLSFFIIFSMAFIFYFVEREQNSQITLPDSLYWSTMAFLAIGFGDISPQTFTGRLIFTIVSFLGVAVTSLPPVILGAGMALTIKNKVKSTRDFHINESACIFLQRYWRYRKSLKSKFAILYPNDIEATYDHTKEQCNINEGSIPHIVTTHSRFPWFTHRNERSRANIHEHERKDYIIMSIEKYKNYSKTIPHLIIPPTLAVRFIRLVGMILSLKHFKRRNGSIKQEDEIRFLITAVKYLGSQLNKLREDRETLEKENENLDTFLNKITKELTKMSSISTEISNLNKKVDILNTNK